MAVAVSETTSDYDTTMDTAGAFGLPVWSPIPSSLAASLRSILNWNIVDLNQRKLTQALSLPQLSPFFPSSLPPSFSDGLASGAKILLGASETTRPPTTTIAAGSLNSQGGIFLNSNQHLLHNSSQSSKKVHLSPATVATTANPVLVTQNGLLIAQSSSDEESDVETTTSTGTRKRIVDTENSTDDDDDDDIKEATNNNTSKIQTKKFGASFFDTAASSSASRSGSAPVVSTPTAAELAQKKRKAGGNLEDLFASILPKKSKLATGASSSPPAKSAVSTKLDSSTSCLSSPSPSGVKSKSTQFSLDDMFSKVITPKPISTLSSSTIESEKSVDSTPLRKNMTENAKVSKTPQEKAASEARRAAMAILGAPSGLKKKKKKA